MIKIYVLLSLVLFTACIWENSPLYSGIEEDKLRVLAVTWSSGGEVAPGDTITARAYFAGNKVTRVDNFSMAYKIQWLPYEIYFPDEKPVTPINFISWLPDSIEFSMVVPADVFLSADTLLVDSSETANFIAVIEENKLNNGQTISSMTEEELDAFGEIAEELALETYIFFNAHSENGSSLKVKSSFVIRYNTMFPGFLPVNSDPEIKWIGLYTVVSTGDDDGWFDPSDPTDQNKFTFGYLYHPYSRDSVIDTIVIDAGYDYYIVADDGIVGYFDSSGVFILDSTKGLFPQDDSTEASEFYNYNWFTMNLDETSPYDKEYKLNIYDMTRIAELGIPENYHYHNFRVWCVATNYSTEDPWLEPSGRCIKTLDLVLTYTDAYIKEINEDN